MFLHNYIRSRIFFSSPSTTNITPLNDLLVFYTDNKAMKFVLTKMDKRINCFHSVDICAPI